MHKLWTKEQAWAPIPNLRNVPIDETQHDFRFRRRWFRNRNQATFSSFLLDKFPIGRPYKMLTIGVFEGAQEVWLMQHVLTHPDSRLFCVDPWCPTTKLDAEFMEQCYANARHNLSPWKDKVNLQRAFSQEIMSSAVRDGGYLGEPLNSFDLVIVDGDHDATPVIVDAVNAYEFVKPGGWILFDDVRNQIYKPEHVWHGIERWLAGGYEQKVKFAWSHRYCDCYEKL